jgi:anti-anti-sigma regulatory factor
MVLVGQLGCAGIATLHSSVEAMLSVQPQLERVVIDVCDLSFADFFGVRALVSSCERLGAMSEVRVCGLRAGVRQIIDLAHSSFPGRRF